VRGGDVRSNDRIGPIVVPIYTAVSTESTVRLDGIISNAIDNSRIPVERS